jgi:hypothetical protein
MTSVEISGRLSDVALGARLASSDLEGAGIEPPVLYIALDDGTGRRMS